MAKNWNEINWKQCYEILEELQYNILMAYREEDNKLIKVFQHKLTRSFSARALAVRKVVSNKGKNTPGIDKVIWDSKELRVLIKSYKEKSLYELTRQLNMKLRGWAEHYRSVTSQKDFNTVNYHVWNALWRKLVRRHRRRSTDWIYKKYFKRKKGNKWIFVAGKGSEKELALFQIQYVEIKRHTLRSSSNAYDVEVNECFTKANATRSKTGLLQSYQSDYLLKVQGGICPECGQSLFGEEDIIVTKKVFKELKRGRPKKYEGTLVHRIWALKLKEPILDQ